MIQCAITLLDLPPPGAWRYDQFADWLHPLNGPLPDLYCAADSPTDHYVVALWLCYDRKSKVSHCITVLECPEKPTGRGSILWSARWACTSNKSLLNPKTQQLVSRSLYSYESPERFLADFIPAVILDAETYPLGSPVSGRSLIIRNGQFTKST
jgi:hypothetical protein